jgi:polyisoprenoid-binding protein YceI
MMPKSRESDSIGQFPAQSFLTGGALLVALLIAPACHGQDTAVQLEKAATKIEFSLGSTLHTVHGTFGLKNSTLHFDPASGKISGAIVVDATTAESGNNGRDSRMHREILESAKFPEIVFTPREIDGTVAANGTSNVKVSGRFRLHGADHEITLPVEVVAKGQEVQLAVHFEIPYVEWGLKNPSNFLLRASDKVEIEIHATGRMDGSGAAR